MYLLDTNICIYYLKGQYNIDQKIQSAGEKNRFISELTVAELKFGVENSSTENKESNRKNINRIINIFHANSVFLTSGGFSRLCLFIQK